MPSTAVTPVSQVTTLNLHGQMSLADRNRLAIEDITRGLSLWRLGLALGWLDIRLRYRGSVLGPFWLTISGAVLIAALGFVYGELFKFDIVDYIPYLALSQVLWTFMAAIVSEACLTFTENEGVIRSVRMPFTVFCVRIFVRNGAILLHNLVVVVAVFAFFKVVPGWHAVLSLPGLLVWGVDSIALALLLGAFCARFRDVQPIVNSILQVAFFITPVIWKAKQLGGNAGVLPFNPFYDLLEIVRGPILNLPVTEVIWAGALGYSAVLCLGAWLFFIYARGRITFWM